MEPTQLNGIYRNGFPIDGAGVEMYVGMSVTGVLMLGLYGKLPAHIFRVVLLFLMFSLGLICILGVGY